MNGSNVEAVVKPASIEAGQVWVLEDVGSRDYPREVPAFEAAYLVLRRENTGSSTSSAVDSLYTTQVLGVVLDARFELSEDYREQDGTVRIDYPENMLHGGERVDADSPYRWRFVT